jgi:hypothetical protein
MIKVRTATENQFLNTEIEYVLEKIKEVAHGSEADRSYWRGRLDSLDNITRALGKGVL